MKVVYIAHPLGPGPGREENRRRAARWCVWAATKMGVSPVADWIVLSGELEETPENRELGLACDVELVRRCDELWLVGGRVSEGMKIEAAAAEAAAVPVIDGTCWGPEPPTQPLRSR